MPNDTTRSLISLGICIHLFCVFVGLFGNQSLSALQERVQTVLTPYCRLLNLDPQYNAGFHLTHAMTFEDDHQLVVEVSGESEPRILPSATLGPDLESIGFRRQRWRTLAGRVGLHADDGNDQAVAEVARAIGESILSETDASGLVFRIRRFQPPALVGESPVPDALEESFQTIYEADVLLGPEGRVRVHKRVDDDEAAQVRPSAGAQGQQRGAESNAK